jgi:UDP-N-acetylmuramate--alanine ligase
MLDNFQSIHLIGANGVGLSAVGKLLLSWGRKVSGSDLHCGLFSDELANLGARITCGGTQSSFDGADMVLYSSAIPESDSERQAAVELGIKQMSYSEFLGELAKNFTTVAVTGTHGKSTTTAMIGKVLEAAGLDPTVIVGTRVPGWEFGNVRVGKGTLLVLEACEYKANHLNIAPDVAVVTNIEMDHPDFYRDVGHVERVMREWVGNRKRANSGGERLSKKTLTAVLNADDERLAKFGVENCEWFRKSDAVGLALKVPGEFNLANAAAAMAVARVLDVEPAIVKKTLEEFPGVWRRFERLGEWHGAEVISDYGHHPTAIRETIKAVREMFGARRLVHVFQPHQHARTKELFDEFAAALGSADVTVVAEIYGVAGRTESEQVSSADLVAAIVSARPEAKCVYAKNLDEVRRIVAEVARAGDVLLFQGAGDIDDVARSLFFPSPRH